MRESDGTSWRFSEDVPASAHLALYVRDAVALPVPVTDDLPPRLDQAAPDRSEVLPDADRAAAASQWRTWWDAIIDAEARAQTLPESGAPADNTARAVRDILAPVLPEPPDFAALSGAPELQRAVAEVFTDAHRAVERQRRNLLVHDRPAQFPWVLLSGTAEQVAADRHVPITALHAQAMVLMVAGEWWTLRSPGVVLTSVAAARNRRLAAEIVSRAFTSTLDG